MLSGLRYCGRARTMLDAKRAARAKRSPQRPVHAWLVYFIVQDSLAEKDTAINLPLIFQNSKLANES